MRFFFEFFTGEAGRISSKRGAMVWVLLLFTAAVLHHMITGKVMTEMYFDHLFELLVITLGLVFGEKILPFLRKGSVPGATPPADPPK